MTLNDALWLAITLGGLACVFALMIFAFTDDWNDGGDDE